MGQQVAHLLDRYMMMMMMIVIVMNPSEICFLICNGCKRVTFLKKLRADYNWGSVAVIQFRIFCLLFKNMMIEIY